MNKHFNKELVMTKEDKEDFENCTNYWIFDNVCAEVFVKVRAHFHKHGAYRASVPSYCNIKIKLNPKIPIVFNNLKNYDLNFIMKNWANLILRYAKVNVMPNGLEKYMSFNKNIKVIFIDSFQFLSSLLNSLDRNLNEDLKILL